MDNGSLTSFGRDWRSLSEQTREGCKEEGKCDAPFGRSDLPRPNLSVTPNLNELNKTVYLDKRGLDTDADLFLPTRLRDL